MNFLRYFHIILLGFALSLSALDSVQADDVEVKYLESIKATQLQLANGMKVCLKPTDYETDEMFITLAAAGGYASLEKKDRSCCELAAQVAWESGLGDMSSDEVSVFLYENSLEFCSKIYPFSRLIEGEGSVDGIEAFLRCVRMVFMQQRFDEAGWKTALLSAKRGLSTVINDNDHVYEAALLQFNAQQLVDLKQTNIDDIENSNLSKTKELFHRCFSDPSEFSCVIVGNFNKEAVLEIVKKYLGTIPRPEKSSQLNQPFVVEFPGGITNGSVKLGGKPGCVTRMTFPLQVDVSEQNLPEIAFVCQVIEARLRRVITEKMALSYGVDVSYEFPVYPLLNNPWISIHFRCDHKLKDSLKQIIITELGRLQVQGVNDEEVANTRKLESSNLEFWLQDNSYWVSMLINYYLWGWNPEKIDNRKSLAEHPTAEATNVLLKNIFSITNYSSFTGY